MQTITAQKYQGYKISAAQGGGYIAEKHGELAAGADTMRQLKHLIDLMILQGVTHESEIK